MARAFTPELATIAEDHNPTEVAKRDAAGLLPGIKSEFRNDLPDITWATEQLAKSYGVYLEFNRAKSGKEKDWMYMVRIGIPGGGPIHPHQWAILDRLADEHGRNPEGFGSLRLTTRGAVQFHWVQKPGVLDIVKTCAEAGMFSLNACGDNVRNVLACPLARHNSVFDGGALADRLAAFFQLPTGPFLQIFAIDPQAQEENAAGSNRERFVYGPQLLNRKFKIAVSSLYRDPQTGMVLPENCVELRTHDLGIQPLYEAGGVNRYLIYVGGGQGEKFGKATASLLAQPLGVVSDDHLLPVLEAVVAVQQDWGDRKNRHWARLKYVIKAMGMNQFRQNVNNRAGGLQAPLTTLDTGPRHLHHGWQSLPDGSLAYGAFIENGRLIDGGLNGQLKTMVRDLTLKYQTPLQITPNQDILFTGIQPDQRDGFEQEMTGYGYGRRHGKVYSNLRLRSGACVGRDTCRLAYTDSEKLEPFLLDELEALGWGHLTESIGITGCERQCFRPATKTIGLVGSGLNRYQVKLMGSEDGRHQGEPLNQNGDTYLRNVPKDKLPQLLSVLFRHYELQREAGEDMGAFHRRLGHEGIIQFLRHHPDTAELMLKTFPLDAAAVLAHQAQPKPEEVAP